MAFTVFTIFMPLHPWNSVGREEEDVKEG